MSEGMRIKSGLRTNETGEADATLTLDFGDGNGIEIRADVAAELGAAMITHAAGALSLYRFIAALEASGMDEDEVQRIIDLYSGPPPPPGKRLDVVTDPGVVRNLNR